MSSDLFKAIYETSALLAKLGIIPQGLAKKRLMKAELG